MNELNMLYIRKYEFTQRTINVWNKLSADCVHASSVNMFKNRIDKYLQVGYLSIRTRGLSISQQLPRQLPS